MKTRFSPTVFHQLAVVMLFWVFPLLVLARAGGAEPTSGDDLGVLGLLAAPFLFVWGLVMSFVARGKSRQAQTLMEELAQRDRSWDPREAKKRIEMVFLKVQHAWIERDQDLARDCMSDYLYEKHKLLTDQMLREGRKNILRNIKLKEASIVEVADYEDDSRDSMEVVITGSMVDYTIEEKTGNVISGDASQAHEFSEMWHFVRGPKGWVLDSIDDSVEMSDLRRARSTTQTRAAIDTGA